MKGNYPHKLPRRTFLGMGSASIAALFLLQGCGGSDDLSERLGKVSGSQRVSTDTSLDAVYSYLRNQALTFRRADFHIPDPPPEAPIWGVLMESNYSDAALTAALTLLALFDGTSSVYLSNGGGVIGGGGHENVRAANAAFVRIANQSYRHLKPCESFPVPTVGQTIFYARTDSGVLTVDGTDADLSKKEHPLSLLFGAGHLLLMRLFQTADYVK